MTANIIEAAIGNGFFATPGGGERTLLLLLAALDAAIDAEDMLDLTVLAHEDGRLSEFSARTFVEITNLYFDRVPDLLHTPSGSVLC